MCRLIFWFLNIDWNSEAVSAAATVVLTVLTGVLAFGSIVLWLSTKRLVKGTEETAERELRAYVFVTGDRVYDLRAGQRARLVLKIKNSGQTPAYRVHPIGGAKIYGYPLPL